MYQLGTRLLHLLSLLAIHLLGASNQYDDLIGTTARRYDLEPAFIKAVVKCESNFDPNAVSPQGAQGLMQLMPVTQATLGVVNPFNPPQNLDGGSRYFSLLKQTFGTTADLLLAAYNAGPQAVITAGYAVPNFPETHNYITCVTQAWKRLQTQGFNDAYAHIPTASNQANPLPSPVLASLQAPPSLSVVGQRLLLHLNAWNLSSDTIHGVVSLTYPAPHFSLLTLRTTPDHVTVQLPNSEPRASAPRPNPHLTHPTPDLATPSAYRFLQSPWPTWKAGEQRTATLALTPQITQDIVLHLSVLVYDHSRKTVQHRWSRVVRLPIKAN